MPNLRLYSRHVLFAGLLGVAMDVAGYSTQTPMRARPCLCTQTGTGLLFASYCDRLTEGAKIWLRGPKNKNTKSDTDIQVR